MPGYAASIPEDAALPAGGGMPSNPNPNLTPNPKPNLDPNPNPSPSPSPSPHQARGGGGAMSGSVLVKSGAVVLVEESLVSSEVGHCIVIQVRARG